MEALWEIKQEDLTPEKIIARLNELIAQWAAEEKAEAEKNHEGSK